jgi:SAM-dependent methyltransferase
MTEADSLFNYYSRQELLPTFGDFKTQAELDRQGRYRRDLFEEKLHLPVALFRNARVVEFGPDSGENALVCAQWGASLSLVEPNPKAVERIRAYFGHFGLESHLEGLYATDLASFGRDHADQAPFDFVIAEGFLHAVRPDRLWIDLFKRILAPHGHAIVFTHDPAGMFTDLLLKAIHARVRQRAGLDANAAAHKVFQGKWDAIPHIRPMEAWVMDQLENPFIRLGSCHDPVELGRTLAAGGLRTTSAWPPLTHTLEVYWHKRVPTEAERLDDQERFYRHHRLSYLFGRSLYCREPASDALVGKILETLDGLIDEFRPDAALRLQADLAALRAHLEREAAPLRAEDLTAALAFLASTRAVLALLGEGDVERIAAFCNHDAAFIAQWGVPVHFRVLRHV